MFTKCGTSDWRRSVSAAESRGLVIGYPQEERQSASMGLIHLRTFVQWAAGRTKVKSLTGTESAAFVQARRKDFAISDLFLATKQFSSFNVSSYQKPLMVRLETIF